MATWHRKCWGGMPRRLLLAEEVLQRYTEHWLFGVGLIIVAVVIAAPNGLVPYLARLFGAGRADHV